VSTAAALGWGAAGGYLTCSLQWLVSDIRRAKRDAAAKVAEAKRDAAANIAEARKRVDG